MSESSSEGTIDLSRNPSAKEEAKSFSNSDDARRSSEQSHELAILHGKQGPLGRLIGCSDSSLTIAFILLLLGFILIMICLVGAMKDSGIFLPIVEKLITFELTVAGYVFGKKSSGD